MRSFAINTSKEKKEKNLYSKVTPVRQVLSNYGSCKFLFKIDTLFQVKTIDLVKKQKELPFFAFQMILLYPQ